MFSVSDIQAVELKNLISLLSNKKDQINKYYDLIYKKILMIKIFNFILIEPSKRKKIRIIKELF